MPRIWADTIDTHRRQVTNAILDATAELIAEHGPMSVAMAAIAERAGIGRATLYKYFPDVESILVAWHTRDFASHVQHLKALAEREDMTLSDVADLVRKQRHHHTHGSAGELIDMLAQTVAGFATHIEDAVHNEVLAALTQLLTKLTRAGEVRSDVKPQVLAQWLLHAVHAPSALDDRAVAQLVTDSLAPQRSERRKSS